MKYSVTDADKNTGDERTIIISAANKLEAEDQARRLGLLVSSVTPREAIEEQAPSASAAVAKSMSLKAAAVAINAPDYAAIKTLSRVFFACACIEYAATVILLAVVALLTFERIKGDEPTVDVPNYEVAFTALWVLLSGILSHGISVVLVAFRDLVRNSFHR
jgi:hypothetical protein